MTTITVLNILGLSSGIAGTIILAISLNRFLKAVHTSVKAHELFIETYTSGGDVLQIAGTDQHVSRAVKKAGSLTVTGIILVTIGFSLQLLQYLPLGL